MKIDKTLFILITAFVSSTLGEWNRSPGHRPGINQDIRERFSWRVANPRKTRLTTYEGIIPLIPKGNRVLIPDGFKGRYSYEQTQEFDSALDQIVNQISGSPTVILPANLKGGLGRIAQKIRTSFPNFQFIQMISREDLFKPGFLIPGYVDAVYVESDSEYSWLDPRVDLAISLARSGYQVDYASFEGDGATLKRCAQLIFESFLQLEPSQSIHLLGFKGLSPRVETDYVRAWSDLNQYFSDLGVSIGFGAQIKIDHQAQYPERKQKFWKQERRVALGLTGPAIILDALKSSLERRDLNQLGTSVNENVLRRVPSIEYLDRIRLDAEQLNEVLKRGRGR